MNVNAAIGDCANAFFAYENRTMSMFSIGTTHFNDGTPVNVIVDITGSYRSMCTNPRKLGLVEEKAVPRDVYADMVWFAAHLDPFALVEVDIDYFETSGEKYYDLLQSLSPPLLAYVEADYLTKEEYFELARRCVKERPDELEYIGDEFYNALAKEAVEANSSAIKYVESACPAYLELVKLALRDDTKALLYVDFKRIPGSDVEQLFDSLPNQKLPWRRRECGPGIAMIHEMGIYVYKPLPKCDDDDLCDSIAKCPKLLRHVDEDFPLEEHLDLVKWAVSKSAAGLMACYRLPNKTYEELAHLAVAQDPLAVAFVYREKISDECFNDMLLAAVKHKTPAVRGVLRCLKGVPRDVARRVVYAILDTYPATTKHIPCEHFTADEYADIIVEASKHRAPHINARHFPIERVNELRAITIAKRFKPPALSVEQYRRLVDIKEDPRLIRYLWRYYGNDEFQGLVDDCIAAFRKR